MVGFDVFLLLTGLAAGLLTSLLIESEDGLKVGLVLGLLVGLVVGEFVGLLVGRKTGRREGLALLEGFIDGLAVDGAALGLKVDSIVTSTVGMPVTSNIDGSKLVGWKVVGSIVGSNATG